MKDFFFVIYYQFNFLIRMITDGVSYYGTYLHCNTKGYHFSKCKPITIMKDIAGMTLKPKSHKYHTCKLQK